MRRQQIVGVDYNEGPPVPIPNTEVKLACADNTWLATARDDRLMPTLRRSSEWMVVFLFSAGSPVCFVRPGDVFLLKMPGNCRKIAVPAVLATFLTNLTEMSKNVNNSLNFVSISTLTDAGS